MAESSSNKTKKSPRKQTKKSPKAVGKPSGIKARLKPKK
jgi:hypothetical protein